MFSPKFLFVLIFLYNIDFIDAASRVPFSRPGDMLRIPSVDYSMHYNLLRLNFSSEILSSSQNNTSCSVSSLSKTGYKYGVSFVKPAEPAKSAELGFHVQKNLLVYGNVNLDFGVQDILLGESNGFTNGLDTREISLFGVLSSNKEFEDYAISTHLGLGTGKIVQDAQSDTTFEKQKIGMFLGFQFITPWLKKDGGVSLLTEYDGIGLNIGIHIPLLKLYQINFSITHFENLGDFATKDKTGADWGPLQWDAPGITLGLTMNIPRLYNKDSGISNYSMDRSIYSKTDSSILFYNPICKEVVETLRDSIHVGNNLIENLTAHNIMLLHQETILVDSIRKNIFWKEVSQSKKNKAMRHLSRSLRFFYDGRYRDALSEVNTAIEEDPQFAIAYGRRGSIYYKLGDIRRATLNWNAALQLDPEFTEIYDMLKASDENRLKSVEISKNLGEN